MRNFAPNAALRRPSGPARLFSGVPTMRLVWSRPGSSPDPPRPLLLSLALLFLGGVVTSSGGAQAPRAFRAALAGLLGVGGVLLVVGGASLALQSRRGGRPILFAEPLDTAVDSDGATPGDLTVPRVPIPTGGATVSRQNVVRFDDFRRGQSVRRGAADKVPAPTKAPLEVDCPRCGALLDLARAPLRVRRSPARAVARRSPAAEPLEIRR